MIEACRFRCAADLRLRRVGVVPRPARCRALHHDREPHSRPQRDRTPSSIPVVADIDTGYGNAINVMRTVREFEAAGVAAMIIEDQVSPKRCPICVGGVEVITIEEGGRQDRAAVAARRNPDMLIIARTDVVDRGGSDPPRQGLRRGRRRHHPADQQVLQGDRRACARCARHAACRCRCRSSAGSSAICRRQEIEVGRRRSRPSRWCR